MANITIIKADEIDVQLIPVGKMEIYGTRYGQYIDPVSGDIIYKNLASGKHYIIKSSALLSLIDLSAHRHQIMKEKQ